MFRKYDLVGLVNHSDELLEISRKAARLRMLIRTLNKICVYMRRNNIQNKDPDINNEKKSVIIVGIFAFSLGENIPNKLMNNILEIMRIIKKHRGVVEMKQHEFEYDGEKFRAVYLEVQYTKNTDQAGLLSIQLDARNRLRTLTQ